MFMSDTVTTPFITQDTAAVPPLEAPPGCVAAADIDLMDMDEMLETAKVDRRHENPGRPRLGEEKHVQKGPDIGTVGEEAKQDYADNPLRLFNDGAPQVTRKREQIEHRIMLMLKAQGLSNREIAKQTNYSAVAVNDILRQPWARTRLLEMIHEKGEEPVAALLRGAAADSIITLMEIRDNENAPAAARRSAADSLLDRFLGKPTQRIESYSEGLAPTAGDLAELDRQIAMAESEEKRILGVN